MKKLIIALALFASTANAASLHFGGWSKHTTKGDFNESHNFYVAEYKSVVLGTFTNSYNNRAYIGGYNFKKEYNEYLQYGVILGAVSGYERGQVKAVDCGSLCPVVMPYIATKKLPLNPQLSFFGDGVLLTLRIDW